MYRGIKQSQTLSLFDVNEENISKSTSYVDNNARNSGSEKNTKEEKADKISDEVINPTINSQIYSKLVKKIIVYYDDNTFHEFEGK